MQIRLILAKKSAMKTHRYAMIGMRKYPGLEVSICSVTTRNCRTMAMLSDMCVTMSWMSGNICYSHLGSSVKLKKMPDHSMQSSLMVSIRQKLAT